MAKWMTLKEELAQRHENLMLHSFEGMAVGYIAMQNGLASPLALVSSAIFGVLWEKYSGKLFRRKGTKPWKASILGAAAFPVGTLAAGAIRALGG